MLACLLGAVVQHTSVVTSFRGTLLHTVQGETPRIKTVGRSGVWPAAAISVCTGPECPRAAAMLKAATEHQVSTEASTVLAMLTLRGSPVTRKKRARNPMACASGDRSLRRCDVLRILHTAVKRAIIAALSFAWVPRAQAATTQSICSELDDGAVHNAGGPLFDVSVGPAGFDSWCPVTVRASLAALDELRDDTIEYVWLKDASSPKARRIYASRKASAGSTAVELMQALKSGYRARPLLYCSRGGLYEGEVFTVP